MKSKALIAAAATTAALTLLGSVISTAQSQTKNKSHSHPEAKEPIDPKATDAITPQELLKHFHIDELHKLGLTGKDQHIAILNYDIVTDNIKASIARFFADTHVHPTVNFIGDGTDSDD